MINHALIFFALFLEGCGGHLTSISQVVLRLAKITKFEARSQAGVSILRYIHITIWINNLLLVLVDL